MSSRRTLILLAAVVAGVVAAFVLYQYVQGVEDRADEDARLVDVYVVRQTIPEGMSGQVAQEQGYIEPDEINAEFRPATAVTDLTTISGQVASSELPANAVLVDDMFVNEEDAAITAASRVPTGQVAITVSVDQVRGVAGLLVPGDEVNLLVLPSTDQCAAGSSTDGAPVLCRPARYLYQDVQIIFVGQRSTAPPSDSTDEGVLAAQSGLITFAVPPDAAQVIASVPPDSLYLTLLPDLYEPEPLGDLSQFDVLPGENPSQLTPYGPDGFQGTEQ